MDKTGLFQSFTSDSDPAATAPRLQALRAELARRGLAGFLIPRADEHQGEYVPPRAERLKWLTGFNGSAGFAIVLGARAAIFIDGRYTLQVRDQVDTTLFTPRHMSDEPAADYLETHLKPGERLGFDPWLHTPAQIEPLREAAARAGAELVACPDNPLDAIWHDQPPPPADPVAIHGTDVAGEAAEDKRARIGADIAKSGADAAVITLPDSICWLLNVRGGDVPHTPFALSFAILAKDGTVDWFIDPAKVSDAVRAHTGNSVSIRPRSEFVSALAALAGRTVLADPAQAGVAIFEALETAGAKVRRAPDPCLLPKACKNPVEIEGARRAHIRDGAALARFLHWLSIEAPKGTVDEISAATALETFRHETGALKDISFDTISGAGPNGAIVHYRVTEPTNRVLKPGELFLVDSGAQYTDGTTDVTRTIAAGAPDPALAEEMRDRFTRVLRGHIALATARFPAGTTGAALDAFARRPLWEAGLDYDHGTGHGVGAYLSVHEGPQNISKRPVATALKPGMICSNEPGYYRTGAYGIRIENLVVVTELQPVAGGERPMMGFETLTLAPIDRTLIDTRLLSDEERAWLDAYHARVLAVIGPLVPGEVAAWLEEVCAPL